MPICILSPLRKGSWMTFNLGKGLLICVSSCFSLALLPGDVWLRVLKTATFWSGFLVFSRCLFPETLPHHFSATPVSQPCGSLPPTSSGTQQSSCFQPLPRHHHGRVICRTGEWIRADIGKPFLVSCCFCMQLEVGSRINLSILVSCKRHYSSCIFLSYQHGHTSQLIIHNTPGGEGKGYFFIFAAVEEKIFRYVFLVQVEIFIWSCLLKKCVCV